MSRKQFTEEQQQKLRQNPYVYSVTATRLSLTREFKELFMEACMSDGELRETQMTNYFSNLYPIDCAVLSVYAQSYRKYGTLPEHEFLPEI